MKYNVTIEETVAQTFEVDAQSIEEACLKVEEDYRDGRIVLEPGDCIHCNISGYNRNSGETVLWNEL